MATAADSAKEMKRGGWPGTGQKVGVLEAEIDLAVVSAELVAQGDGVLATGDIIQCLNLPQGTMVLRAGFEITETVVGVAALPLSLGITGGDTDHFVGEVDIGSSTSYVLTDYVPTKQGTGAYIIGEGAAGATSDTIDLLCGTVTATSITAGKLRVFAVVADVASMEG